MRSEVAGLDVPEVGVGAVVGDEVIVVPFLGNLSVAQHEDAVGVPDGGEPMCDDECGFAFGDGGEVGLNRPLGFGVHGTGGLVEDHHGCVLEDGAGDAEPLALSAGKPDAALAHHGLVALRKGLHELMQLRRA